MKKITIITYTIVTIIDYISTLPVMQYEENPVARYFIDRNGELGLFAFDVVAVFLE